VRGEAARTKAAWVSLLLPCLCTYSFAVRPFALRFRASGDVTQVLMPPDPPPAADEHIEAEEALAEVAAGAAAGASPARVGSKRKQPSGRKATRKKKTATGKAGASSPSKGATDRLAWDTLKPKWHALVKKLAQYLGFTPEEMEVYRVQDSKVMGQMGASLLHANKQTHQKLFELFPPTRKAANV
jgi:hypothetical protein